MLEPKAVAEVLLFPAYLGFNGKQHAEGTSFVHLGEAQWDAGVDLWDDATDPRALGSPSTTRAHRPGGSTWCGPACPSGWPTTGGRPPWPGRRRPATRAATRPTFRGVVILGVLVLVHGNGGAGAGPGDVLAGVERGLLVTDLWYNRILDPKTQVVTGLTRNGLFLIEGGEVVGAVRNLRYTQSVAGAFGPGRVLAFGDDARLVGQDGVRVFTPSVRLGLWAFTGDATG